MQRSLPITFAVMLVSGCQAASLESPESPDSPTDEVQAALDGTSGNTYVNYHRDRLLDAYASYKGLGDRVAAWSSLNAKQRDLFLIQTDLLGNRSFMENVAPVVINNSPCDGQSTECSGGCQVQQSGTAGLCVYMDANSCVQNGFCYEVPGQRWNYAMALEHVTTMYELLGADGSCGGEDNNRIFWSADDALIGYFRNYGYGLPEWDTNGDLGGPHGPFNNASSTITGRPASCDGPDGQVQFYSYDWQAQWFQRGNAFLPADGHMFELDDDYNTFHDSSPECSYCGGQYGRTMYEDHWCSRKGNGAPCDWGYTPTAIAYQGWLDTADCNIVAGWAWDAGKPDARVSVDVYLDGAWLARLPADQYRGDLQAAGIGDGAHGFSWAPPTISHDHTWSVRIVSSSVELAGSPKPAVAACGG